MPERPSPARPVSREEAFALVAANVAAAAKGVEHAALLVTSPGEGEGKTSTAVHLAAALATAGQRVVLADLDLRNPAAHRPFGLANPRGATEVLLGELPLSEVLQHVTLPAPGGVARQLALLPAGRCSADAATLLGGERAAPLLDALTASADIVVLDTPPVLAVADALQLARLTWAALLVVQPRRTSSESVRQARDALRASGTNLLGVVMSGTDPRRGYGYRYAPGRG